MIVTQVVRSVDALDTCGIYLVRCLASGDTYVGAALNVRKRWHEHQCYASNHRFRSLQNQFGQQSFTIELLEECEPRDLSSKEVFWFNKLKPSLNHSVRNQSLRWVGSSEIKANKKLMAVSRKTLDFPGLGKRIKEAREFDDRSLAQICRESGISRAYWYQLEGEDMRSPATEEIVRKVEQVLSVDLGINFD